MLGWRDRETLVYRWINGDYMKILDHALDAHSKASLLDGESTLNRLILFSCSINGSELVWIFLVLDNGCIVPDDTTTRFDDVFGTIVLLGTLTDSVRMTFRLATNGDTLMVLLSFGLASGDAVITLRWLIGNDALCSL